MCKIDLCINELLDTEANYIKSLDVLVNHFGVALRDYLHEQDHQLIFGRLVKFLETHLLFDAMLNKATEYDTRTIECTPNQAPDPSKEVPQVTISSPDPSEGKFESGSERKCPYYKVAECFLNFRNQFLEYDIYCANLASVKRRLTYLVDSQSILRERVSKLENESANHSRQKLMDLLLEPMQRMTKYPLILAGMLRYVDSSEIGSMKRAHRSMVDVCQHLNDSMSDTGAIETINKLEESISGLQWHTDIPGLQKYGRLIKNGLVKLPYSNSPKILWKGYFILQETMLTICCENGGKDWNPSKKYKFRSSIPLKDLKFSANSVDQDMSTMDRLSCGRGSYESSSMNIQQQPRDSNSSIEGIRRKLRKQSNQYLELQECSKDRAIAEPLMIRFDNRESRRDWIEAFSIAFSCVRPEELERNANNNHLFEYSNLERTSICGHCNELLSGLFFQGYECRMCKICIHKHCLTHVSACQGSSLGVRRFEDCCIGASSFMSGRLSPSGRSEQGLETNPKFEENIRKFHSHSRLDNIMAKSRSELDSFIRDQLFSSNKFKMKVDPNQCQSMISVLDNEHSLQSSRRTSNGTNDSYALCRPDPDLEVRILRDYFWFKPNLSKDAARILLRKAPPGTFLVRPSETNLNTFVISLNYEFRVKHIRIQTIQPDRMCLSQRLLFRSLIELICHYEHNSLSEDIQGIETNLVKPLRGSTEDLTN